tara:strand:- start:514 stop:987 length:474 start_codon:yes stop_codon:yes gene_type:complete
MGIKNNMKKIKLTEKDLTDIIRKVINEDAGRDTPGGNPEHFYGDGSLDRLRKFANSQEEVDVSKEEIVKTLWQIQGLLSEGAPAIALRRVVDLLGKMGEDVEFSDGEYTTIEESRKPINEENVRITQATMERYMEGKFKEVNDNILKSRELNRKFKN